MQDQIEHPDPPPRPRPRSRRWLLGIAAAGAAAGAAGLWVRGCGDAEPGDMDLTDLDPSPDGKTDLTFFVAADTHFGVDGIEALNRTQIEAMNALPAAAYPPALGGRVARPTGLLVAGDLTQDVTADQWSKFVRHYGLTGRDGLLKWPVQECTGNHDRKWGRRTRVESGIIKRHGSLVRGWVWQGVCFFCLDCYPDAAACNWLERQLKHLAPQYPAVMFFHYSILGPYSGGWSDAEKRRFADVIRGHNVLGIFHGHYHASQHYTWQGFDVYNVGSPRHAWLSFAVAHITDPQMTVASRWSADRPNRPRPAPPARPGHWSWTHRKQIRTAATVGRAFTEVREAACGASSASVRSHQ